jgi:hypothetical protein
MTSLFEALARGERAEVDEEVFEYFLEVLPPKLMSTTVTLVDGSKVRATYGYAEGADTITAFWREGGRYFAQHTTLKARG